MATEIVTSFWPINDNNGDPVSGAKIYVYDVGTTTLQSLYSDTSLSVSVSNPIITNSAGRTTTDGGTTVGMVYKATGSYKIVVKTSADVTLHTLDNIDGRVPVGSGALAIANGGTGATTAGAALTALGGADAASLASLAADVASLAGAASSTEKTHIATGTTAQRPASPTEGDIRRNTTTARWEGYNGSAAWETFFTNTEIASSGDATTGTDNTKVMTAARVKSSIDTFAGEIFIEAKDASGGTVDFTGLGSTYDRYRIDFSNVKMSTDGDALWVRIGTGGTPTYQTTNYSYQFVVINSGASTDVGNTGQAQMLITNTGGGQGVGNATGENCSGWIEFDNPDSTDIHNFRFHLTYNNTSAAVTSAFGGCGYTAGAAFTAVRFLASTGNLSSGRFVLSGKRRA